VCLPLGCLSGSGVDGGCTVWLVAASLTASSGCGAGGGGMLSLLKT